VVARVLCIAGAGQGGFIGLIDNLAWLETCRARGQRPRLPRLSASRPDVDPTIDAPSTQVAQTGILARSPHHRLMIHGRCEASLAVERLGVFAATLRTYPVAMDAFELSERWCSWKDLDAIFSAAHVAIEAGPFDPAICEIVFNEEFDPFAVDTLEEAREHLRRNPRIMSMDIILSHIDEDDARLTLRYSGGRLQINGYGRDWTRARAAYNAAQGLLSGRYGITTFKLPELPLDTVAETRKRLEIEALEAALENIDWSIEDR
jgi:hypothetical protein